MEHIFVYCFLVVIIVISSGVTYSTPQNDPSTDQHKQGRKSNHNGYLGFIRMGRSKEDGNDLDMMDNNNMDMIQTKQWIPGDSYLSDVEQCWQKLKNFCHMPFDSLPLRRY